MKMPCNQCGCHFPQDFDETFSAPCNIWGDMGASNLPDDYKKRIWDWFFTLPADEMGLKFSLGVSVLINFVPIQPESMFENRIPGYSELDEAEKQAVQKKWFKEHKNPNPHLEPKRKEAKS